MPGVQSSLVKGFGSIPGADPTAKSCCGNWSGFFIHCFAFIAANQRNAGCFCDRLHGEGATGERGKKGTWVCYQMALKKPRFFENGLPPPENGAYSLVSGDRNLTENEK